MKRNRVYRLVVLAMLTAVSIILTRFLVIYLTNSIRISLGNIPIMLAGVWFGPVWGLVVGFVADFLGGTVFSALGWYAPMTISPMVMGLAAGLLARMVTGRSTFFRWCTLTLVCNIPTTMLWTTLCLSWMYGTPFWVLLPTRLALYVGIAIGEGLVLYGMNQIPVIATRSRQFAKGKHSIEYSKDDQDSENPNQEI
ncbi:MAG: folate family ECF transporter S component [Clostridia bacterium]|nr:folate family ECF transporter S component [Clostridia bacterium]